MEKNIILTLISLSFVCLTAIAQPAANRELVFNKDRVFRIMQLTDIHYNTEVRELSESSIEMIGEAARLVKPDLIVLTGDVVVSVETATAWREIGRTMDATGIPWTVVFGNHDSEYALTNRQILDILSEYKNNLTENGPEEISGNGNYLLTVASSSSPAKTAAALYFFDTKKQHEWIAYDQQGWYRRQSARLTAGNGGTPLPALAFYHIPVPEFNEVIGKPTTVGEQKEVVCCPVLNSGSFTTMYECKDVMGIFVGHDHDNNYIGCLQGICLAYGYKTGRQSYGAIGRGVRVIELQEGERRFTTWLLQMYECNREENTWIPVSPIEPRYKVTYPDAF
jgi:hypothetical protein